MKMVASCQETPMASTIDAFLRDQLLERRNKLENAVRHAEAPDRLHVLLDEVDTALARMEEGSYGICETCHDPIESDRLIADPLVRFCLSHLSAEEQDALEHDLQLAARVQRGLLPKQHSLDRYGWQICYHYEPARVVSGDYCDVIDAAEAGLYFMVGDVSGKGVAASMLMAHLHAMFRALIPVGYSLKCMLEHASHVFGESTLPNQYATLVCGRALADGTIELANAGHPLPLVARNGGSVMVVETSDFPLGMFCQGEFSVTELELHQGDSLVIYSDGVSDATNTAGEEYGTERLHKLIASNGGNPASALLAACRDDLIAFRSNGRKTDDVTLFVLARKAESV
jgi:sigma-B regulation protein RsbU (phosphoserine phosphatase)